MNNPTRLKDRRKDRLKELVEPWSAELWALGGSSLSFAVMVALLGAFDGRPIFAWKGVTLNGIISVLSVCMKASLMFAVAECMGQWKWVLLSQRTRPLIDFERIDQASRGPYGSLKVLWSVGGSWCVRLGAAVVVLVVALDPFSQQLLQLQQGVHEVEAVDKLEATSPRVEEYTKGQVLLGNYTSSSQNPDGPTANMASTRLDLSMQAAILGGLSRPLSITSQQATVQCPANSCTWPEFETLGVCYKCNDITSDLRRIDNFGGVFSAMMGLPGRIPEQNSTAFALPNGHFLPNIYGCRKSSIKGCNYHSPTTGGLLTAGYSMTSFGTGNASKTNSMRDLETLIWAESIIHFNREKKGYPNRPSWSVWPTVPLRATECAIYYCVKQISSRVVGNIIREDATDTNAKRDPSSWKPTGNPAQFPLDYAPENIPAADDLDSLEFNDRYSVISYSDLVLQSSSNSSKPKYSVHQDAVKSISAYFQSLLTTNLTTSANVSAAISKVLGDDAVGFNGAQMDNSYSPPAIGSVWSWDVKLRATNNSFTPNIFAALAASMTNDMRRNGDFSGASYPVIGVIEIPTTFYKTVWGWIALHAAVLLGALVFWRVTVGNVAESGEQVPLWKNSSLAVLGRAASLGGGLVGVETVKEMEKRALDANVSIAFNKTSIPLRYGEEGRLDNDRTTLLEDGARPS